MNLNRRAFSKKSAGAFGAVLAALGVKTATAEKLSTPMAGGRLETVGYWTHETCKPDVDPLPAVHLHGQDWPAGSKRLHVQSRVAKLNHSYTAAWKGKPQMKCTNWAVVRVYLNRDGTETYEFVPADGQSELLRKNEPIGTFS
ncbi:MAG: hypothetical protein P4L67_05125 [Candidatus Pacebacteria bacterium]|nr:hypothetical protein [Candidatus Paceibacterota bacterium]